MLQKNSTKIRNIMVMMMISSCLLMGETMPIEPPVAPMPNLHKYTLKDFHLAKSVKYFDIKWYMQEKSGKKYTYGGGWAFDMEAYRKLSTREQKKIRSSFPSVHQRGFTAKHNGGRTTRYFIHYIDRLSRVHIIDTRTKLKHFLGKIDTKAEADVMTLEYTTGR